MVTSSKGTVVVSLADTRVNTCLKLETEGYVCALEKPTHIVRTKATFLHVDCRTEAIHQEVAEAATRDAGTSAQSVQRSKVMEAELHELRAKEASLQEHVARLMNDCKDMEDRCLKVSMLLSNGLEFAAPFMQPGPLNCSFPGCCFWLSTSSNG